MRIGLHVPRLTILAGMAILTLPALGVAGLTAPSASAAPVAAAAGAPPGGHYNVGATHSPQLLRQLAGPARSAGITGSGTASGPLAPAAKVTGDEQGVDVAAYQHPATTQYPGGAPINWTQVAGSGVGFAAIKATEGNYYTNPWYASDLPGAMAAGLPVVAYALANPASPKVNGTATQQAQYLVSHAKGSGGYLPPLMLDIEYNPYSGGECYGLKPAAMVSWITAFEADIQSQTGRLPIIYTPPSWWATCTGKSTAFGQTPLWVPDYSSATSPSPLPAGWGTWSIWQYSSTGNVPGIQNPTGSTGNTDLDQANPAVLALLNPGNQRQVAGAPVGLQMSEALPVPGQVPSYTATGLPPDVSISTSGRITGWLMRAGTYNVTVSASAGGASGSATFTEAVAAAPDQGPTGEVHYGLAGMCLDDAGNATAAGTKVDIAPCNSASTAQQWTYAQDESLRIHGECASISGSAKVNGATVVLGTCAGYASQRWTVATGGELINATASKCLTGSSSATSGAQASISTCAGTADQQWTLPPGPVVSQIPGLCMDDTGGSTAAGTPVAARTCDGLTAQDWTAYLDGTVRVNGACLQVQGNGTASGTPLELDPCNSASAGQQWHVNGDGGGVRLKNPQSGLCVADPGDSTVSGTTLVIAACNGADPGIGWRVR
jgi:GH25 family lysozyme M1 (1,4-beta-N-acetylmuramidase)